MTKEEEQRKYQQAPFPILVINENGKVVFANDKIGEVFIYDQLTGADLFTITGKTVQDIEEGTLTEIERNGKNFRLEIYSDTFDCEEVRVITFLDVTAYTSLKKQYNDEKPCCMKIEVDNYDDLIYPSGQSPKLELSSDIDKIIRVWINKLNASLIRTVSGKYCVWFERRYLSELEEKSFPVLDEIRSLETGVDFPASLSIGVGAGGKTLNESEEYAETALELALGRGGDQVAVNKSNKITYYGGKIQQAESRSKGKSKMVGHAIVQLIKQSKNVVIMGHRFSDMDSFGSAMGMYRLVTECDKDPYIVIDEVTESLEKIYNTAKNEEEYSIISSEKAMEIAGSDTLLIIVDTHRKTLVQCPGLLDVCDKVVIIDHHRRVEDMIDNPTLAYMETYASSASELVTEILQFMTEKKKVNKLEAEALLCGIIIDTNAFAMQTGVRTFETAAWLRRQGADPAEVKKYFQESFDNVKIKSLALLKTQIYPKGIAITTIDYVSDEAQVMCAQLADELLKLKGVAASFVVGKTKRNTVISARSLGGLNVQTVMEKFGGGGHLMVAAAQVDTEIEETVDMIKKELNIKEQEE